MSANKMAGTSNGGLSLRIPPGVLDRLLEVQGSSGPLESMLSDPATQERFRRIIGSRIDDFLDNRMETALPGLSMFIDQPLIDQLKTALDGEINRELPGMIHEMAGALAQSTASEQESKSGFADGLRIPWQVIAPWLWPRLAVLIAVCLGIGGVAGWFLARGTG